MLARDEQIDSTVAVEVAEDGVLRVANAGEAEARSCVGEGAIEVVAVHSQPASNQKKIQIAVVIEIDEERLACTLHVSDSGFRGHLLKRAVAAVAK